MSVRSMLRCAASAVVLPETSESHPRLVADIGGTNARFAWVEAPDAPPGHLRTLRAADHAGPAEAASV